MSIEQLQMVVDLLRSMGAEGKELFIWWLALTKGADVFFGFVWSGIGLYAIYRVLGMIANYVRDCHNVRELERAAGIEWYFNRSELKRAADVLRKHYHDRPTQ